MPFTNPSFPGQIFRTVAEYDEARKKRAEIEKKLATPAQLEEITRVTATILPAEKGLLETKVSQLEREVDRLRSAIDDLLSEEESQDQLNKEGITVGGVLVGESKGRSYTLEVLDSGYLCSDGQIYQSLSGAALGVSGNRRSGWRFWKVQEGQSVGEKAGRFLTRGASNS